MPIPIAAPLNDVTRARTPPAAFYVDPARLARENATAMKRCWQYVAHAGQLGAHGDYCTAEVSGEPLLLLNDGGRIRGYYNVCRHRAGPLAEGSGRASRIVCRYHGWSYDLQGGLLKAPEMTGVQDFDPAAFRLQPVAVHQWGPLVFAALDPGTAPFDEFHPQLTAECAPFHVERMSHIVTIDYPVAANWKVYVDNFLEGYHVPMVHPALNREIDYRAYVTELATRRVLQHAPVLAGTASVYRQEAGEPDASYYWLYPNLMLNLYAGRLQVNVVIPDGVERTVVRFAWFGVDGAAQLREGSGFHELRAFAEVVQAEDAAICQALQRNLHSSAYAPGPYSPLRESGVHHFHRLLLDA